ncbi:hypothetical protein NP493_60g02009 [Ridgeia piscesae]|uniref:Uncharacterized protein n=1 Tax=Ridgeia piscesae TaxID=27915 RepID=A0AAD9PAB1_RIDPI|nr:hypothetical protein NP493_60g02009 [Ridgeia piscesae]
MRKCLEVGHDRRCTTTSTVRTTKSSRWKERMLIVKGRRLTRGCLQRTDVTYHFHGRRRVRNTSSYTPTRYAALNHINTPRPFPR